MPATIDAESLAALELVKKGKPRKFAMICKGVQIQSLTVFKKGKAEAQIKKAKKDGFKGKGFTGVVHGKGMEIKFDLASSDGFDSAPTKDIMLKAFLKDAGFKCAPEFRIVNELIEVSETDDEDSTATDGPSGTETTDSGERDPAKELTERLKVLMPSIKAVTEPPQSEQLKQLTSQVSAAAQKKDYVAANQALDQVEQLLRELGTEGSGSPPSSSSELSPDFANQWTEAKSKYDDANEQVNRQLEQLRSALQSSGDPDLEKIADMGLNAVTADFRVPMQAALLNVDRASGEGMRKAIADAREAVTEFYDHIENDERVEVCDDNPFEDEGVKVSIRGTLGVALADLNKVLANAYA